MPGAAVAISAIASLAVSAAFARFGHYPETLLLAPRCLAGTYVIEHNIIWWMVAFHWVSFFFRWYAYPSSGVWTSIYHAGASESY